MEIKNITKSLTKIIGATALSVGLATSANAYSLNGLNNDSKHLGGFSMDYNGSLFNGTANNTNTELTGALSVLNKQNPNYLNVGDNKSGLSTGQMIGLGVLAAGIVYTVTKDKDDTAAETSTGGSGHGNFD